ncbi:MAG: lamin tail domain-containing protein [Sandaracinaceae bacterium]
MAHRLLPALACVCLLGCLRVPPAPPDAAPPVADEGVEPLPPFTLAELSVEDARGEAWDPDDACSWPTIRLRFGQPLFEADAVWLLEGEPDPDTADDLSARPLRVATERRVVESEITLEGDALTLRPTRRLEAGATYTVAVAAWARSAASGETLEAPQLAPLTVSRSPEAGGAVRGAWPPDGADAVDAEMSALFVAFDGAIEDPSRAVRLRREGGEVVATDAHALPCADAETWPDGLCAVLRPRAPLAPGSAHVIEVETDLLDATGAPVGPWAARFTTRLDAGEPPAPLALTCHPDEHDLEVGCALVDDRSVTFRLAATEAVRVRVEAAGRRLLAVAPRGDATLRLDGLSPEATVRPRFVLTDYAGATWETQSVLSTTPPLATISIEEVRADPLGPEPRQEYVEVLNWGDETVDLLGFSITDRASSEGDFIPRTARLAPGQRALIVGAAFDPEEGSDPEVPPGTPLIRLEGALGTGGLANRGEPVFLRDPEMRRISAAPGLEPPAPGVCVVRRSEDPRVGAEDAFGSAPCTPGRDSP